MFLFLFSEGSKVESAIAVEFMEQNFTKCINDTRCRDDTRACFNDTSCTIKLLADHYNPELDQGDFRVVVSQGDTSAAQTVVVDANPQGRVLVTPFSVSMYKVWQRHWCLFHAYMGEPSFMTYQLANLCLVATQIYSANLRSGKFKLFPQIKAIPDYRIFRIVEFRIWEVKLYMYIFSLKESYAHIFPTSPNISFLSY